MKFTIPGRPVPAVRMTQRGKYVKKNAQRYLEYKTIVGWIARKAGVKCLKGKVGVDITIYLAGGLDGDWDNYGKSITDALNKIAYKDDRQISDGRVVKVLGVTKSEERAEVCIWEEGQIEQKPKHPQLVPR